MMAFASFLLSLWLLCSSVAAGACRNLSKAELTTLFNTLVASARFVSRPGNWSNSDKSKGFHVGVEVAVEDGDSRWLIHHTVEHKPVVTCASESYSTLVDLPVKGKKTVGGARAAAGDDDWSAVTSNCVVAATKIALYLGQ